MAFFVEDGAAVWIEWDSPEHKERVKLGMKYFSTLGGCALHGGVEVTVFDKPIKAEPVYNGFEAMAMYPNLPEPTGVEAQYKIVVFDGEFFHPPVHFNDLPKKKSRK